MSKVEFDKIHEAGVKKVQELCDSEGYGFVMQVASKLWLNSDSKGALVVGPCAHFTRKCHCPPTERGSCDLCYGCGWVFRQDGES